MKYVGGYSDLLALERYTRDVDWREWDRVLIAIEGEADAQRVENARREAERVHPPR